MEVSAEKYRRHLEKAQKLAAQRKRRPLPTMRGLSDFFEHYPSIAGILELKGVNKTHLIGLGASMGYLKSSESAFGLFSDSFDAVTENIAKGILEITQPTPSFASMQVIKWWLQLALFATVGLLELAKEEHSNSKVPFDPAFRDQLLIKLLFYSNYPKRCFQNMAEALLIPASKQKLFVCSFEILTLSFALIASSKNEEGINPELVSDFTPRIQENLATLAAVLDTGNLRANIEQMQMALEKQETDHFLLTCEDLLNGAGYGKEKFQNDISAIKGLFKRYKQAYISSREKPKNMVHMLG